MAKKSFCTFILKTPHQTIKTEYAEKAAQLISEDVQKRAIKIAVPRLAQSMKIAINRSVSVGATFFQRVVARTPLDEDYMYIAKNGVEKKHEADNVQCRMDWFIECNGIKITAREMNEQKDGLFNNYNDKESIDFIRELLLDKIEQTNMDNIDISVGNNNEYFATLEYGKYDVMNGDIKQGEMYEHGIENKHSVQAPVGMLRVTQMELQSMINSSAKTPLSTRFRKQVTEQNLSDERLESLLAKFKASKRLPLSDIKRYVGL